MSLRVLLCRKGGGHLKERSGTEKEKQIYSLRRKVSMPLNLLIKMHFKYNLQIYFKIAVTFFVNFYLLLFFVALLAGLIYKEDSSFGLHRVGCWSH